MAMKSKTDRKGWSKVANEDISNKPSEYTRGALPLALTWFLLPLLALIISTALFGRF